MSQLSSTIEVPAGELRLGDRLAAELRIGDRLTAGGHIVSCGRISLSWLEFEIGYDDAEFTTRIAYRETRVVAVLCPRPAADPDIELAAAGQAVT